MILPNSGANWWHYPKLILTLLLRKSCRYKSSHYLQISLLMACKLCYIKRSILLLRHTTWYMNCVTSSVHNSWVTPYNGAVSLHLLQSILNVAVQVVFFLSTDTYICNNIKMTKIKLSRSMTKLQKLDQRQLVETRVD